MPDINAGQILRFEDGGRITVRAPGSGTDLFVLNVLEGTLRITPPGRASLPRDIDRGTLLNARRRGNQQPGTIDFDVKFTATVGATELLDLIINEGDLALAALPAYQIDVEFFQGPDRTGAGREFNFTQCTRNEMPQVSAGAEFDTLTARWDCVTMDEAVIVIVPVDPEPLG